MCHSVEGAVTDLNACRFQMISFEPITYCKLKCLQQPLRIQWMRGAVGHFWWSPDEVPLCFRSNRCALPTCCTGTVQGFRGEWELVPSTVRFRVCYLSRDQSGRRAAVMTFCGQIGASSERRDQICGIKVACKKAAFKLVACGCGVDDACNRGRGEVGDLALFRARDSRRAVFDEHKAVLPCRHKRCAYLTWRLLSAIGRWPRPRKRAAECPLTSCCITAASHGFRSSRAWPQLGRMPPWRCPASLGIVLAASAGRLGDRMRALFPRKNQPAGAKACSSDARSLASLTGAESENASRRNLRFTIGPAGSG